MDARRIRPLFLPPHPRRNRYIPICKYAENLVPVPRNFAAALHRDLHQYFSGSG